MYHRTLLAMAFVLTGTAGFALTQVETAVQSLTDQGFTNIEVKQGAATTKIEATRGTEKVEITIDSTTGDVIKSETSAADDSSTTGTPGEVETGDDSADDNGDDNDGGEGGGEGSGGGDSD